MAVHGGCMYCQKQACLNVLVKVQEDGNLRFKKIK